MPPQEAILDSNLLQPQETDRIQKTKLYTAKCRHGKVEYCLEKLCLIKNLNKILLCFLYTIRNIYETISQALIIIISLILEGFEVHNPHCK